VLLLQADIAHEIKNFLNFVNNFSALSSSVSMNCIRDFEDGTRNDPREANSLGSDLGR